MTTIADYKNVKETEKNFFSVFKSTTCEQNEDERTDLAKQDRSPRFALHLKETKGDKN